jgi:hypothetical protein
MAASLSSDERFAALLRAESVTLTEVQQAAFGGVAEAHRASAWKLLLH